MALPDAFRLQMQRLLGTDEFLRFEEALAAPPSVSIRCNPKLDVPLPEGEAVPWCVWGRYLPQRPSFTSDPLFHAGGYYVQEASSMFLEQVMRRYVSGGAVAMLDLCAAPGGKSTHARALLPEGSLLVSNEVMRARAWVLAENLTKWGHPDVVVTHSDPAAFASLEEAFDVVLADVPCSGEGMFRKDEEAVADWSTDNVALCAQRQRRIVGDVWPALKPGGLLIYSTCTYNTEEDEANVQWICDALGAEVLPVEVPSSWGITGSLWPEASFPVCRFLPHRTRGEGLFMAVLRKQGNGADGVAEKRLRRKGKKEQAGKDSGRELTARMRGWLAADEGAYMLLPQGGYWLAFPSRWHALLQQMQEALYIVQAGVTVAELKGRDLLPCHALAMSRLLRRGAFPEVEVEEPQAVAYLRKEALVLPVEAPRGMVLLTYRAVPLGFVKNLGNRANNLYPQEWRIRKQ